MNAVLGSIIENLRYFEFITNSTVDVFKGDKTYTGDSKEITVNEFISSYLPNDFQVKKGKIYSQTSSSANIDCVVLAPNHPKLFSPIREVIIAEGVYAAVEVKPDISTLTDDSEFFRGLLQIKSIKNLDRKSELFNMEGILNNSPKPTSFYKIPSVIFSFKSANAESTIKFMIKKIEERKLNHNEIPDLIVTLDKGIILYTPSLPHSPIGNLSTNVGGKLIKEIYGEQVFIHFEAERKELTLILFLIIFLNFIPPALLTHTFILKDYLGQIEGSFSRKVYPLEPVLESKIEELNLLLKIILDDRTLINNVDSSMIDAIKRLIESGIMQQSDAAKETIKLFKQIFKE